MSACDNNIIDVIYPDECLKDSLIKINSNFNNLQTVTNDLVTRFDKQAQIRTFFYYGPNASADAKSGMAGDSTSRPSNITIQTFCNSTELLNLPSFSKTGDVAYVIYQKTGYLNSISQNIPANTNWSAKTVQVPGKTVSLNYDTWYNVDNYSDVVASCDGAPGTRLGTIELTFKTPTNAETKFTYRATGRLGDDTYLEWNRNYVTWSEGYPAPKTAIQTVLRPYINISGTQFKFTRYGTPYRWFIKGQTQTTTTIPQVLNQDIINQFSPVTIIWRLTYNGAEYVTDVGFPKFTRAQTSGIGSNWNTPTSWSQFTNSNT